MKKTFLVKIIPPDGYSVYRLAFTRRHLAAACAILAIVLLTAAGVHTWQLHQASADVRALQALTTQQQQQLKSIDTQADALANQLRSVQRENAEIRRLIGADRGGKQHAMLSQPRSRDRVANFNEVQARLHRLARVSQQTRDDAARLQRLAMRVLNLRHLASAARERMIAEIPSIMPVNGELSAGFGWRTNPWPEFHKGVDLAADYGTVVRAAAAGTVEEAGYSGDGFGIKVTIDHGNGYETLYGHLSRVVVQPGQHITKGAPIAFVGSSGESTGPHLHYQVMKNGDPIDPQPFLSGVPPKVMATLPDPSHV